MNKKKKKTELQWYSIKKTKKGNKVKRIQDGRDKKRETGQSLNEKREID
jgi:hypothetical protein